MTNGFYTVALKAPGRMNGLPVRRFGLLLAALVSVSAYPALFIYFYNIREGVLAQVFPPTLIFIAVGLAAWLLFGLLSGSLSKGACIAFPFLLVFMNYSLIEDGIRSLVPDWRWWRIAPAFLFLFINLAFILRVFVKRPEDDAAFTKIGAIIGAVFLALILFNAARGIYALACAPRVESSPAKTSGPSADNPLVVSPGGTRPNFYFFIFDEYARQDVLKKYTGYDNTPFLKGLERKKFNVSYSSYSTSSFTPVCISNSLHYCLKYKDWAAEMQCVNRYPLFDLFKKAGYKTYALSEVFKFDKAQVDVELQAASTLPSLSIDKTVMAVSFINYLHPHENEEIRADKLGLLQHASAIVQEKIEKPKFLFFHFMGPHEPLVFDENGGPVAYENMHNFADTRYYLGQLRFLTNKINELADTILKKDPHAVVLLQSDHGIRFFDNLQQKERLACLNNLYVGGQAVDIEGFSRINTLRHALNHALSPKLELVREGQ